MPAPATLAPSTAERVRSACARSRQAVLAIDGSDPVPVPVQHLRACGDVVLTVPTDSAVTALSWQAGRGGLPAVLELTDQTPLPLREPVRSLVWLRGALHAVPAEASRALAAAVAGERPDPALLDVGHKTTLLRLVLDSAVVADSHGAEPVPLDDLLAARPDPFHEVEDCWLEHLESDHGELIALLARRLPRPLRTGGRIRPLGLDRYGVRLRVEGEDADRDVRISFADPVDDAVALNRALRRLRHL
ncbi:DUF2470 domain-containing protein [Rhodococcus spelaei]|uniref:DUF2470 domain-containing protein n=1 Tax=Rhodococcus spelaei TaxID=2546320 RepID=A0A541BR21_9NOCA|nr:DUF2470 domain-containing protein [Rhodococcus spelaei]TQF74774.1 DUF2470 domain-containing protein [Rhodococcus spelaei]